MNIPSKKSKTIPYFYLKLMTIVVIKNKSSKFAKQYSFTSIPIPSFHLSCYCLLSTDFFASKTLCNIQHINFHHKSHNTTMFFTNITPYKFISDVEVVASMKPFHLITNTVLVLNYYTSIFVLILPLLDIDDKE